MSFLIRVAGREEAILSGTRFFGTLGHWDLNDEVIYQFGQFGSGQVNAWSVATDHGYTLGKLWGRPRLGLRAAVASGDSNANDADLQTFNPLFVRGNYFSEAGLLSPQNFFDLFPSLRIKPSPKWAAELGSTSIGEKTWATEFISRRARRFRGSPIYPGNRDFARFVGTELVLGTAWQATRHITLFRCLFTFLRRAIHSSEQRRRRRLRRALGDLQILSCCPYKSSRHETPVCSLAS